jgi:hypothetical protein
LFWHGVSFIGQMEHSLPCNAGIFHTKRSNRETHSSHHLLTKIACFSVENSALFLG